jgi:hypothetical protein
MRWHEDDEEDGADPAFQESVGESNGMPAARRNFLGAYGR